MQSIAVYLDLPVWMYVNMNNIMCQEYPHKHFARQASIVIIYQKES